MLAHARRRPCPARRPDPGGSVAAGVRRGRPVRLAGAARGLRSGHARGAGRRAAGRSGAGGRRRRGGRRWPQRRADRPARSGRLRGARCATCSSAAERRQAMAEAAAKFVVEERSIGRAAAAAVGRARGGGRDPGDAAMTPGPADPPRADGMERERAHPGADRRRAVAATDVRRCGGGGCRRPGHRRGVFSSPLRPGARDGDHPHRPHSDARSAPERDGLGLLRGPAPRRSARRGARRDGGERGARPRFPAARRREPARGVRPPAGAAWRARRRSATGGGGVPQRA